MKQGIDLHPRASTQLSAGFLVGLFSSGTLNLCFPRAFLLLQCFGHKPGCGRRVLYPCPCAGCSCYYFSLFMSCSSLRGFSELSPLSLAAPGKSGRQSAHPLHEGFLFLIKLAGASPEGLVEVAKVKDEMLELLFLESQAVAPGGTSGKGRDGTKGSKLPWILGVLAARSFPALPKWFPMGQRKT